MNYIIYFLLLWIVCGAINVFCVYLAKMVYKRPDYENEFKLCSFRTILIFISGALCTPVIWVGPLIAFQNLQVYKGK